MFLFGSVLAGCRIDYDMVTELQMLEEDVPNLIMEEITFTQVDDWNVTQRLSADRLTMLNEDDKVIIEDVEGRGFKADAETELEGRADFVDYNQSSKNAVISGNVYMRHFPQDLSVWAENMEWNDETKEIKTRRDEIITISRGEDSVIEGRNLTIDARRLSLVFEGKTSGVLRTENSQ